MASTIAALTAGGGGVATTADSSGNLNLLSGTTTVLALTATGIAVTGTLSASGVTTNAAGSAALPSITTTGDTDTGVWFPAANTLAASTGGVEAMRIDSSGNVLVGDTAAVLGSKLCVKSAGNTASTNNCIYKNSSATSLFVIRDDGYMSTGLAAGSPYNSTTASAANLFVYSADGALYRSTSSIKYKTNVKNATHGLSELLKLRPVSYQGKNEIDSGKTFGGLIAEEVHEVGLTEFVQYAEDGTPDALAYGHMVALCVKAIQEQQALITQLQADVSALKGVKA